MPKTKSRNTSRIQASVSDEPKSRSLSVSDTTIFPDFRSLLVSKYTEANRRNPNYSLRSFAKCLGIDPSRLSKIFRGERPISDSLIEKIGVKIGLDRKALNIYRSQSSVTTEVGYKEIEYMKLELDQFEIISDWRHYAILEFMKLKGFSTDPKIIGKYLNMPISVVNQCIDRLQRVKMLEIDENGVWTDLTDGFSTHILDPNYTSHAHKKYQSEIMDMAREALFMDEISERDHSSLMVATSKDKIQKAKTMIKIFRRKLAQFMEDCDDKDAIYQLNISLFSLCSERKR